MKLKFLIDKEYIFLHAFNRGQREEPFKGWGNFTMKIWDKHPQECYLLAGFSEWPLIKRDNLKNLSIKAQKLLNQWLKAPQVKRLIRETGKYQDWVEREWKKVGDTALNELQKITKIPLPQKTISVYITHPKLRNGVTLNQKTIVWGHPEDWKNYSVVYICHEIMHTIFWENKSKNSHAIIELVTDNELRIRLNKKGKYFKEKKFGIGHEHLRKIEQKILPRWKDYLKNKGKKNIFELERELRKIVK